MVESLLYRERTLDEMDKLREPMTWEALEPGDGATAAARGRSTFAVHRQLAHLSLRASHLIGES